MANYGGGIANRDYYGASQRGREDALNEQTMRTRNALSGLDLEMVQRFNALASNPQATPDDYSRIGRSDVANALTNSKSTQMKQGQIDAERLFLAAQYGIRAPSPKAFIQQHFPEIAQMTPGFAEATDDVVRQDLQSLLGKYGPQAGIAPAPEPVRYEEVKGPRGSLIQRDPRTGEMKQIVGPDNTQAPAGGPPRFRPMSIDEKRRAGLPDNASAQVDESTGKIDVLSQPPRPTVSPKDVTTVKSKLVQLNVARQQIAEVRKAWAAIKDSAAAGPFGQGRTIGPKGKAFDRAVDRMRGTITAITRVPGIGSMSDWEGKLDQAKFPDRTDWEDVTEDQIAGIEQLINSIDTGYKDILSGNDAGVPETAAPQPASAPIRVNTPQEAAALPSGTVFITPDGRTKVRP